MAAPLTYRFEPGEILSARKLNLPTDQAERDRQAKVGAPLASQTSAAGRLIRYEGPPAQIVAKITSAGSAGLYGGTEQVPQPGGTWVDGVRTFTAAGLALHEINGNTGVPTDGSVRVFANLAPTSNEFLFQFSACNNPAFPPTLQNPTTMLTPRRVQLASFIAASSTPIGTPLALSAPIGP